MRSVWLLTGLLASAHAAVATMGPLSRPERMCRHENVFHVARGFRLRQSWRMALVPCAAGSSSYQRAGGACLQERQTPFGSGRFPWRPIHGRCRPSGPYAEAVMTVSIPLTSTCRSAQRRGYHAGRTGAELRDALPIICPCCGGKPPRFTDDASEDCECGWVAEFEAAYRWGACPTRSTSVTHDPGSVYVRADGGWYFDGYDPGHLIEVRDVWCFRSALRAMRHLRDVHGRSRRGASRNYSVSLRLSYCCES
jgi:hypothetical protein